MQKIIFFLGVAALCFATNTVEAKPGDLLQSLFKEQSQQLSVAKPAEATPVGAVLMAAPTAPSTKYSCKADDVVNSGSTLVKNTIDIMTDTFGIIYKAMYLSSDCTNNAFKCFFQEFSSTKDMITDVKDKVMAYAVQAQTLTGGISYYFKNCSH